jgi:hypothetical protein
MFAPHLCFSLAFGFKVTLILGPEGRNYSGMLKEEELYSIPFHVLTLSNSPAYTTLFYSMENILQGFMKHE